MIKKSYWCFFVFYLALFGAFCGLEVDTYIEDLPFFQTSTFLLLFNVLFVLLIPPFLYALFTSLQSLRANQPAKISMLVLNSIYFHLVVLLLLYKAARDIDFDFYFFWYNISVALSVLWKLYARWLMLILISMAVFVFFQKPAFSPAINLLRKTPRKARFVLATLLVSSALCQLLTLETVRGSTAGFLYANFLSDRSLRTDYHIFYQDHITTLRNRAPSDVAQAIPSRMGDIVFFIQQESLNDLLVSPEVTPELLRASQDGILFRRFYGNSIQSLRGYECILCGVPPSAGRALVDDYPANVLNELRCLPKVFKALGYQPILFYSGNPNPRVTSFFEYIGFETILAEDILQESDIRYSWGCREDLFFTRVHEYLQKHHSNDKLFIFITISATNHTPFKILDDRFLDKAPYPRPKKLEERLSNTTFVQDAYLGYFYDIYKKHYADRATLIAVSDHAWPIPIHKNNIFNERGGYEENFLISMLYVPPSSRRQEFAIGSTVTHRFSQMDIVPTVLDLIGVEQNYLLGESFAPWLLASPLRERSTLQKTKISIQPYGGGFISAVRYPEKYLFDVLGQDVKIFNLENDPREQSPAVRDVGEFMFLIREFFRNGSPD